MAGTAPVYDNVKWGGQNGCRIPQEVFPATMAVIKETDINVGGAGTTNTITIDPTQTLSSYYTLTNAGSGATTINFPVLHNGFQFTVYNNSGQSSTWKATGKTGIVVANGKRAILVYDKVALDIARVTADT
jgi:S-adenosylhomocysteine hydrolase